MRAAGAVLASVGVALLAAACGDGSSKVPAQQGTALVFARCMRSSGVPSYPDPDRGGHLVKESVQALGVSTSQFQSAESACRHLLPNGGEPPSPSQRQRIKAQGLQFARCVRAHGVPSFPDPDSTGRIPDPASVGIDQGSPKFKAANQACAGYRPPYIPSNAAYDAWARTHPSG